MHILYNLKNETSWPLFVVPYEGFVKVLERGDTLVISSRDSNSIHDIQIRKLSQIPFLTDYYRDIKEYCYSGSVIML